MADKVSDDLRQKIIEATIATYSAKGIADTTITDIANKLKISASQVAYHFGSIKNVYPAVVKVVAESARNFIHDHIDQREKSQTVLESYIEGTFLWGIKHKPLRNIWAYVLYTGTIQEEARKLIEQTFEIARGRIESALYEYCAKKKLPSPTTQTLPRQVHLLLIGEMVYQPLSKSESDIKKKTKDFLDSVNALVTGYSKQ